MINKALLAIVEGPCPYVWDMGRSRQQHARDPQAPSAVIPNVLCGPQHIYDTAYYWNPLKFVPHSNFGHIMSIDTWAETESGARVESAGANLLDLHYNDTSAATANRISPAEIDVTYVGPP
ncbi:hypothetical protein VTN31DRAFT_1043 [Thermomyces dupontii]|uniref:uncharacterized protein n=1 Tax=Talaromyces thermophilus TaxID=28565 RepID=UPI00374215B0